MLGKFISVEGIEGAGKSTAMKFIKEYLVQKKIDTISTREPGGTTIAEAIRQILLTKHMEPMTSNTELLLMFASRAQHLQNYILPSLQSGRWVVSDRFIDASYAYQHGGRGIDLQEVKDLDKWIVGNDYPDLTLLLDISPEIGLERAHKRGSIKDRIEEEQVDFFSRVRKVYLERAVQDPKRIKIIDASKNLTEVQAQIRTALNEFIVRH